MNSWLNMGGYAAYVWSAYAIFAVVLLIDAIAPQLRRRRVLEQLRGRIRRERTRASVTP